MRKLGPILLTLLLSMVLVTPGSAQNVRAGVKAGIDFADLGGDFEDVFETSTDMKTGFSGGAYVGFDVSDFFRLQLEGQYVQKGTKLSEEGIDIKFKLDYIELLLPLTVLIPIEGGTVQPRLYVGPSLAFEMSCKVSGEDEGVSLEFDCDGPEVGAPTNSIDYGVFFGGGIDLQAGPGMVTIDLLYNLGIGDIADEDEGDPVIDVNNKNIQVLVGYGFPIGGP
ncbi:MAG: PorT family protein [Gemmatimonadota bacterium]|nr:MAG: PorT family protein [Gemmatimonadota bacterium]